MPGILDIASDQITPSQASNDIFDAAASSIERQPGFFERVGSRALGSIQSLLDVGSGRGFGTTPPNIGPVTVQPLIGKSPVTLNPAPASLPSVLGAVGSIAFPGVTAGSIAGGALAPEAGLPEWAGEIIGGTTVAAGPAIVRKAKNIWEAAANKITARTPTIAIARAAQPQATTAAEAVPKPLMTAEQALATEERVTAKLPAALTGGRLSTETSKKVFDAAENVMTKTGRLIDPEVPITYQVAKVINEQPEAFSALKDSLKSSGIGLKEFADSLIATESSAGRQLQQAAALQQRLQIAAKANPELTELLDSLDKAKPMLNGYDLAAHFFKRAVNTWRASLVTAWSTAVRNLATQAVRVGMDGVEDTLNLAINNIFRLGNIEDRALGPNFKKIIGSIQGLFSRGKQLQAKAIVAAFPEESERLFSRFSSDIAMSTALEGGKFGPVAKGIEAGFNVYEKGLSYFNVVNSAQEFLVRRSVFRSKLDQLLTKQGLDISRIAPTEIDPKLVTQAVDKALEVTFAISPKQGLGKWFVDLYSNPVGKALSFVAPFPRFMYNAWKFQFEHSPLGFLKLLQPAERAAVAAGNPATISKALIGSGMLYAAYEIRSSDIAGEKWYETKLGDKRIDWRPFAPMSSYLFAAELMKRLMENRPQMEIEDLVQGLGASQFRAGAGLYALDQMQSFLTGLLTGDPSERATRAIRAFAGEVVGGLFQPITTFRELFTDYGKYLKSQTAVEEAKLRETREEPFMGPIKRRVPGWSQTLPEKELPLRAENPSQESVTAGGIPLSRQLTGLGAQTRTLLEAEVNRLALHTAEILPRTGESKADRLILHEMGPLAEKILTPVITSSRYQKLDDVEKRLVLVDVLGNLRAAAQTQAAVKDPATFTPILLKRRLSPRMRELLQQRGIDINNLTPR